MSLRRRVLLVFLIVNLLTLVGLASYGLWEGRNTGRAVEETKQQSARRAQLALDLIHSLLQREMNASEQRLAERSPWRKRGSDARSVRLMLALRSLPVFDQPAFRALVKKAMVVRLGPDLLQDRHFNLRRRFILDEGAKERGRIRRLLEESVQKKSLVRRGNSVAGPLVFNPGVEGGFYFALDEQPAAAALVHDRLRPLKYLLVIAAPGVVFLFWFLMRFMNQNVLTPLEELGRVAKGVGHGDYSLRVEGPFGGAPLPSLKQAFNDMLGLVEDYRQRMEARVESHTEEIKRKTQELMLAQRLVAIGTLASGIAHEINNPLGGMLNAFHGLRKPGLLEAKRKQYEGILEEGIERIGQIVRRVLMVSPQESQPVPVDLADVVGRTAALVRHRARIAGVTLSLELDRGLRPVLGERAELGQVVLNLLINGIDACGKGGRVEVSLQGQGDEALLVVADDGEGMTAGVAARAFEYFFTTKQAGQGTGLGLAIVQRIVVAHGGRIELATRPGEGARFKIRLPFMGASS